MSIFGSTIIARPKKSKFNLSFDNKMSCKFGWEYPIYIQETLPGDRFRIRNQIFMQFAPLSQMTMHRFDVRWEYFFVPTRIIYDEFAKFIVGGDDGDTDYTPPCISIEAAMHADPTFGTPGSLSDFLGIPTVEVSDSYLKKNTISLLPFLAYQTIYNEYYRDQNLIPEIPVDKTGKNYTLDALAATPNTNNYFEEIFSLRRRAYPKDYFTSCLPSPQAGSPVKIPQSGGLSVLAYDSATNELINSGEGNRSALWVGNDGEILRGAILASENAQSTELRTVSNSEGTIDELRTAIKVQEWKEKHSRGGGRYKETIAAHFGEIVPDYRIDRPVFLLGQKANFSLGNLYSTDFQQPESDIVQGYPVSNGVMGAVSKRVKVRCQEHGFIIGLVCIYPKAAYFQGLGREWQRLDKFDYFWPEFAHLGEQAVRTREVYGNAVKRLLDDGSYEDAIFGYQSRYAEYKSRQDQVHGEFRTSSMLAYHDARRFTTEPTLSKNFIEVNPQIDDTARVFNDTLGLKDYILCDVYHDVKAIRPMPRFGIPTF